jgi:capsular polysaccharide biosynthesis protein
MDIFAILRSLRRHWVITLVVAALTVGGSLSLLLVMPRNYESSASYVLVNPDSGPTQDEIAADPSLAVNRNNPYLRFSNPSTVGQVLSGRVSAANVREELTAKGAGEDYRIAPSPEFGGSGQVLDLVGTGTSPQQAEETLRLVADRMVTELTDMQAVYGADPSTFINVLPVAAPTKAKLVLSGTVRAMVGFAVAGVLLLFSAISVAEATDFRWSGRQRRRVDGTSEDDGDSDEGQSHLDSARPEAPLATELPLERATVARPAVDAAASPRPAVPADTSSQPVPAVAARTAKP